MFLREANFYYLLEMMASTSYSLKHSSNSSSDAINPKFICHVRPVFIAAKNKLRNEFSKALISPFSQLAHLSAKSKALIGAVVTSCAAFKT